MVVMILTHSSHTEFPYRDVEIKEGQVAWLELLFHDTFQNGDGGGDLFPYGDGSGNSLPL